MNRYGDIILIEDDIDEIELLGIIFNDIAKEKEYKNNIIFISGGSAALEYLKTDKKHPFLIISDINMPGTNGLTLRKQIMNEQLINSYVPYLFLTTSELYTQSAYELDISGYFIKPSSMKDYTSLILNILSYWKDCKLP